MSIVGRFSRRVSRLPSPRAAVLSAGMVVPRTLVRADLAILREMTDVAMRACHAGLCSRATQKYLLRQMMEDQRLLQVLETSLSTAKEPLIALARPDGSVMQMSVSGAARLEGASTSTVSKRDAKVWIFDDDVAIVDSLHEALADLVGFDYDKIQKSYDPARWEEFAKNGPPDLVVTDLNMPRIRGNQLIEAIAAKFPRQMPKFVLLCAPESDEDLATIVLLRERYGVSFYKKPFTDKLFVLKQELDRYFLPE